MKAIRVPFIALLSVIVVPAVGCSTPSLTRPAWLVREAVATDSVVIRLGRAYGALSAEDAKELAITDARLQAVEEVIGLSVGLQQEVAAGSGGTRISRKVWVNSDEIRLRGTLRQVFVEPVHDGDAVHFDGYALISFDRDQLNAEQARLKAEGKARQVAASAPSSVPRTSIPVPGVMPPVVTAPDLHADEGREPAAASRALDRPEMVTLTTVPRCDRIRIEGSNPRWLACDGNPQGIVVYPGDREIRVQAGGYSEKQVQIRFSGVGHQTVEVNLERR